MKARLLASTTRPICFCMVSSADHIAPVTGLSPTVTISKNGAAFAAPAGAVSEVGNGWYQVAGNATDRDTLGELLIHATGAGADPWDDRYTIVAFDPFDVVDLGLTNLDTMISSRLATAGYTAPDNAAIAAIDGRLPSDPADQSLIIAATTAIIADTDDIQTRLPAALVGGRMASIAEVVGDKTGYALTAAYDLAKTAAQSGDAMALTGPAIDAILDDVVEGALTLRQITRILLAAVAGKSTGGGTNYRDVADGKNRIAATVDGSGNRTAVVLDGT